MLQIFKGHSVTFYGSGIRIYCVFYENMIHGALQKKTDMMRQHLDFWG